MARDQDELIRLAKSVADGVPIDWDREERTNASLKGTLRQLQAVERIAAVHQPRRDPGED